MVKICFLKYIFDNNPDYLFIINPKSYLRVSDSALFLWELEDWRCLKMSQGLNILFHYTVYSMMNFVNIEFNLFSIYYICVKIYLLCAKYLNFVCMLIAMLKLVLNFPLLNIKTKQSHSLYGFMVTVKSCQRFI